MRNHSLLLMLLFALTFSSCRDHEVNADELKGTWRLEARLVDSGGGGGEFIKVNSNKTLIFLSNQSYTASVSICDMFNYKGRISGSYDETNIYAQCDNQLSLRKYEINNDVLLLYYQCYEPCVERYIKIAD